MYRLFRWRDYTILSLVLYPYAFGLSGFERVQCIHREGERCDQPSFTFLCSIQQSSKWGRIVHQDCQGGFYEANAAIDYSSTDTARSYSGGRVAPSSRRWHV